MSVAERLSATVASVVPAGTADAHWSAMYSVRLVSEIVVLQVMLFTSTGVNVTVNSRDQPAGKVGIELL